MVGFPAKPAVEEEEELPIDQDPKVRTFKDAVDFPSIDSYLDFDSFTWLGNNPNIEEFGVKDTDFDYFEDDMEIGQGAVTVGEEVKPELCGASLIKSDSVIEAGAKLCDDVVVEPAVKELDTAVCDNSRPVEDVSASVDCSMKLDEPELKKPDVSLASCIEVGLEKVSLSMGDDEKNDEAKGKSIDIAESESETSSSSSSSSSSGSSSSEEEEESDEEDSEEEEEEKCEDQMVIEKEDGVAGELEEGEIESGDEEHEVEEDEDSDDDDDDEVNEMVAWSNDEDEEFGMQTKDPIRSKNELKDLPPVPAVEVTLEPHHTTLPVGVVLSVMSTQVIVEGMETHSPLTEGSILWITESRTPLGLVDEIFGPVKCPYYIVRFNSESEVPEGVSQGTPVSSVADFAQHILNIKELQKKGYDASGDNDEEIPDELEFSDDEKEAEYRRMQKMEKRGMMNDQKAGNTRNKKKKNRDQGKPTSNYSGEWTENQGSSPLSSNRSDPQMGGPVSNHQPRPQMGGPVPSHQPRPQMDGFPPNNGAWRPQGNQQNPYQLPPMPNQMGMPNLGPMQMPLMGMQNQNQMMPLMGMQNQNQMMFPPQFNGGPPGGLNFFPGQGSAPWPALVGQNCFNQQQFGGMGLGIQRPQLPNELNFNMFASQGFQMQQPQTQMQRPQFQMQPQFQSRPQYQMLNNMRPQSPMNPQFQMQPQPETRPPSQVQHSPTSNPQSPLQPESQGFSTGQSSERGRGHRGRGRGRGRGGRGRFGRGRGRGRQQSG